MELVITNLVGGTVLDGYAVPTNIGGKLILEITESQLNSFTQLFSATNQGKISFTRTNASKTELLTLTTQAQRYAEPLVAGNTATAHGTMLASNVLRGRLKKFSIWSAVTANTDNLLVRL